MLWVPVRLVFPSLYKWGHCNPDSLSDMTQSRAGVDLTPRPVISVQPSVLE